MLFLWITSFLLQKHYKAGYTLWRPLLSEKYIWRLLKLFWRYDFWCCKPTHRCRTGKPAAVRCGTPSWTYPGRATRVRTTQHHCWERWLPLDLPTLSCNHPRRVTEVHEAPRIGSGSWVSTVNFVPKHWRFQRILLRENLDPNGQLLEAVIIKLAFGVSSVSAQTEEVVRRLAVRLKEEFS